MLCFIFFIFAIVSCNARDVPITIDDLEIFNVTAVQIPSSLPGTGTRIIGGTPTSIQNYPYTVQILYNRQLNCGGTLLTRRHVLSAGHCFVTATGVVSSPSGFQVRAGTTNLNSGGTVLSVSAIIVHERYNNTNHDNDVAVVLLSSALTLSASVQTAVIPLQGDTLADNSTVVVVGWGRTNIIIPIASSVLNEVSVRIVNRATCAERYNYLASLVDESFPITENMICAGLLDIGGADACQGDSGGPLIYEGIVVGITSWGFSCAQPRFPGVYAKVSMFTDWINQTVSQTVIRYPGSGAASLRSHAGIAALLTPLIVAMLSVLVLNS